jgi:putative transposase
MPTMDLQKNSHQVYELGYHIIFCTKYRHDVLVGPVEIACRNIIAETCAAYGWPLEEIDVRVDHVHMFVRATPQTPPSEIAKTVKSISAVHIFHTFPRLKGRKFWGSGLWSPSTYFGSVGHISEDTVRRYIQNQKKRS